MKTLSDKHKDNDCAETCTVDPTCVVTAWLASSSDGVNSQTTTRRASSDTEQKSDLLDSLRQTFISSVKKSPPIATQIADFIGKALRRHGERALREVFPAGKL